MILQLLKHWGEKGFDDHVENVKKFYKEKADIAVEAAKKHLSGNYNPKSLNQSSDLYESVLDSLYHN